MTDVRASYAHASPRSLREHPRPCATLARVLGIHRCVPEPRVPLGEHVVVVEAGPPVIATVGAVEARVPLGGTEPRVPLGEHVVVDARPPVIATVARSAARTEAAALVEEVVPC